MKKLLAFLFTYFTICNSYSQNVGIGTTTPNASALLDITSADKGVLVPRLTQTQRDAISNPATGLLIFQTNGTVGFYYNIGTPAAPNWTIIASGNNGGWSLTGNSGTDPSTNFIGTTDGQPLRFRVKNLPSGIIDSALGNTAFGFISLSPGNTGGLNTAVGYKTLYSNMTGSENTATGGYSLYSNTTGYLNTATGSGSLQFNTTGYYNTANGAASLKYNSTGYWNTANGVSSLYSNTTGHRNTAIGFESLFGNTTGMYNTAIGTGSLYNNTTGHDNAAFGIGAGSGYDGSLNTMIGASTDIVAGGITNATALGYQATVDASNKVRIGNEFVTSIGGHVGWSAFSDARIKKDIKENVPGLRFINELRPVSYHYNIQKENELTCIKNDTTTWAGKNDIEKINFSGLLAQEVDAAAKKINYDFSGVDKTGKILSLRYADFVPSLIKAVQELSQENQDLKKEIEELKQLLLSRK